MTTVRPLAASSCDRDWPRSISITAAIYEKIRLEIFVHEYQTVTTRITPLQ